MAGNHDPADDEEWWGRPQDDPALRATLDKRRADFRREHPPVTCWVDMVGTAELFLEGVRRALVDRGRALIMFFDSHGGPASSIVYLRSENPYDVAEAHLGIARVCEVRDESDEADEILSAVPREREDRMAAEFRSRHYPDGETLQYLQSAVDLLRREGTVTGIASPIIEILMEAIGAEAQDQHEQARTIIERAAFALETRTADRMFGDPALADCRRAVAAIERIIAGSSRRPLRRGPE